MKSKEEAIALMNKAYDDSVTLTGLKRRAFEVIDEMYKEETPKPATSSVTAHSEVDIRN